MNVFNFHIKMNPIKNKGQEVQMIVKILTPDGRLHRQDRITDKPETYALKAGIVRVEPDGKISVFARTADVAEQIPLICTFNVTLPPRRKGSLPEVVFSAETSCGNP
ncbi:MAG: hypothetical protein ACD_24C00459G0003 [uncultured bacterium]|nr:MAG: hypothetical protein ACD_24C00459G0003 [uncultured bacterium]